MVVRASTEVMAGAFLAVGVLLEAAVSIKSQIEVMGPSAIFGSNAVWQWGLVLTAGILIFKAGSIVQSMKAIEKRSEERQLERDKLQAEVNRGIMRRIDSLELWRSQTDSVLMEFRVRAGIRIEENNKKDNAS